jgi:hypothetical protein
MRVVGIFEICKDVTMMNIIKGRRRKEEKEGR